MEAYEKKIIPQEFEVGELVLKENHHKLQVEKQDKGKFNTNWIGPYIIKMKYLKCVYILVIVDGKVDKFSTNANYLKPFYV